MFLGQITDRQFVASCPSTMQKILPILAAAAAQEDGKYFLADGMFYVVMEYQTAAQVKPETHRNYVDVQLVLRGKESMGWGPLLDSSVITEPYDEEKDVAYYQIPQTYTLLQCPAGICAVFFPNDIHAPGLSPVPVLSSKASETEMVKKVVGKIPVHLLCNN